MRNVIDWKDRLFEGHNQRWGFITVAATITDNLQKNGRTEAETDAMIVEFIKKLVPATHKESVESLAARPHAGRLHRLRARTAPASAALNSPPDIE